VLLLSRVLQSRQPTARRRSSSSSKLRIRSAARTHGIATDGVPFGAVKSQLQEALDSKEVEGGDDDEEGEEEGEEECYKEEEEDERGRPTAGVLHVVSSLLRAVPATFRRRLRSSRPS
jgi:hypothetical protein